MISLPRSLAFSLILASGVPVWGQEPEVEIPASVPRVEPQSSAAKPAPKVLEANPTDYAQIVSWVTHIIERDHYSQKDFDPKITGAVLDHYFETWDQERLFFTKEQIRDLKAKLEPTLHVSVFSDPLQSARVVFEAHEANVKARTAKIENLLRNTKLDFESKEVTIASRRTMAFPENEAEADLIWQKRLTNDLIEEQLAEMRRAEEKKPGSSTYLEKKNPQDEVSVNKVLKFYQRYQDTLRQIGPEEICTRFLSAVCHTFDPHSDYLSAPEGEDFMNDMRKHLVGIGIRFSKNEGHAEVESIIVNGPAHRSGAIHPKDRILKVGQGVTGDLTSVEGLDSNKIADKIRGEPGSVVRLEILPQNDASQLPVVVTLRREKVDLLESRAKADLIVSAGPDGKPSKVGWISIDNFYGDPENNTVSLTEDVSRLLDRLQQEKVEGLVIDLRNNPGGYLEEAVSLAGLFMDRGPVVQERDAKGRAFPKSSRPARAKYAGPLVVVTDRSSASASEIFAACIQDRRRGVVVGEAATFGKGTVQTVMQVAEHLPTNIPAARAGTLKLTIRKFYRVAGGSTQLKGVVPDIILPSRTETTTFGEEALPGALAFDTIPQLTYQPSPALPLFELRLKAEKRLEQDREFAYIRQDFEKIRQQALQNSISLNRTDRVAEWKEKIAQTRLRKQERAAVADKIKAEAKVYRLTTENYHKPELFPLAKALEIASGAEIVQKDIFADKPEDFPNLMEPVRVESLSILRDLIGLAKSAETAQREPSAAKPSGG